VYVISGLLRDYKIETYATLNLLFFFLIGALAHSTGDFGASFYLAGIVMALAVFSCVTLRTICRWENCNLKNRTNGDNIV